MTTTDYLQREIRRTELSIRRAEHKPNTPPEELRGLHEKLVHLQEALEAVNEHWQRVHEQRGWTAHIDQESWELCMWCALNGQFGLNNYCSACGRPLTDEAWAELERRVFSVKCKFEHDEDCCNSGSPQYMCKCKPNICHSVVPITNGDRIRAVSDEELARALLKYKGTEKRITPYGGHEHIFYGPRGEKCGTKEYALHMWTDWLRSEGEEE